MHPTITVQLASGKILEGWLLAEYRQPITHNGFTIHATMFIIVQDHEEGVFEVDFEEVVSLHYV